MKANSIQEIQLLLFSFVQFTFAQFFERISIAENIPINTTLFDLKAGLKQHGVTEDLPENSSAYASEQESFWPFMLKEFNIKLARPLDRETICKVEQPALPTPLTYRFMQPSFSIPFNHENEDPCKSGACCRLLHVNIMKSSTDLPIVFYLQVIIIDVNDNSPTFPQISSPYTMIREDANIEQPIWLPRAFDPDSSEFGIVEYRTENWIHGNSSHFELIYSNNQDQLFNTELDATGQYLDRPYLKLKIPLDREKCELYAFTLIAIDGGERGTILRNPLNRARSGSVSIVIQVQDVNDNIPTFDQSMYTAKLAENTLSSIVVEFEVSDADVGDNGRIVVTFDEPSGYAQRLFRLSLQRKHQTPNVHLPTIRSRSSSSNFKGSLQLLNPIDAERLPPVLKFSLVASDFGQPSLSSRAEIQIEVINTNDNAPTIAFYTKGTRLLDGRISLTEVETPRGALVVLVHVTDEDSPITLIRCHLLNGHEVFALEETSGSLPQGYGSEGIRGIIAKYRQFAIRTKTELDREEKSYYLVTVECTDAGGELSLSRNESLHVTITDINDNPPVFDRSNYQAKVVENSSPKELQFLNPMRVTDKDIGSNSLLTFTIFDLDNETSTNAIHSYGNTSRYFRIDPRSGQIWTLIALDCEARQHYTLMVVVHDSGSPKQYSASATVYVTVEDVNDNVPEFTLPQYTFDIIENAPGGTEIGRIEAIDRDVTEANRKVRYSARGPLEDLHLINIDRHSGLIRSRRPIDRESRSSISLEVTAENEVPISLPPTLTIQNSHRKFSHESQGVSQATVVINILNVNDNRPEFSLIEPHKSHMTFIWEQLGNVQNQSSTSDNELQKNTKNHETDSNEKSPTASLSGFLSSSPLCERIPHRVTDKDFEPDNHGDCCLLELLDDYDGLFYLMPEASNVLCVMRRPPTPKSYRLTLVARDGNSNDSLSAQVQFTVVIQSDPNLRALEQNRMINHPLSPGVRDGVSTFNRPHYKWTDSERLNEPAKKASQRYHLNGKSVNGNFTQHTIIIIVMVTVSGILCVLLILAILLTKRCIVDGKLELNKPARVMNSEQYVGTKISESIQSSPSRSQSCSVFQVPCGRSPVNPDFYATEMAYHHPLGDNRQTYELAIRQAHDATSLISPTLKRSTIDRTTPRSVIYTGPVLISTENTCDAYRMTPNLLDMKTDYEMNNTKLRQTPESVSSGVWKSKPPVHSINRKSLRSPSKRFVSNNTPSVIKHTKIIDTRHGLDASSIYQTIDSRMINHVHPHHHHHHQHQHYSESESVPLYQDQSVDVMQGHLMDLNCTLKDFDSASLDAAAGVKNDISPKHRPLQRTNSECSNSHLQTSFV